MMNRARAAFAILAISLFGAGCPTYHAVDADAEDGGTDRPRGGEVSATCQPDEHACAGICLKKNDPANCGSCGRDCSGLPNIKPGAAMCRDGKCVVAADGCVAGTAHCSANPDDVCETDLGTPEHCGSCTNKCPDGAPLCSNAAGTRTCVASCSGTTPDKCSTSCVDLKTDVNNCGTCGKACGFPNGEAACVNGECVMSRCKDGFGDCTGEPGCETQLNSASHCGACGKSCMVMNGSATCTGATCGPVTCAAGWGDCDADPGCETALTTPSSCGKCGLACDATRPFCSTAGGQQACVSDCTGAAPTKCGTKCVDTRTDVANCGSCGTACDFPNAESSCVNDRCAMVRCRSGFADCNAQPGCETPLGTNTNCASCGQGCGANLKCDATHACVDICTGGAAGNPGHCCSSSDCPANRPICSGHTCVGKPLGQACTQNAQCAMGFCVDGVCCNTACNGQCEACDATPGTCLPVAGPPHPGGLISRPACGGHPNCQGLCDGSNRTQCAYPSNRCRVASCSNGAQINEARCDSAGRCPAEARTTCEFVCVAATGLCGGQCRPGTTQCPANSLQTCSSDGSAFVNTMTCPNGCDSARRACAPCDSRQNQSCPDPGNECRTGTVDCRGTCSNLTNRGNGTPCMGNNGRCNNGTCVPLLEAGRACQADNQCLSGNCRPEAGGSGSICCNADCDACSDCNSGGTGGCIENTSDARAGAICGTNRICYFGLGCQPCGGEFGFCCSSSNSARFNTCSGSLRCQAGSVPSESQCVPP